MPENRFYIDAPLKGTLKLEKEECKHLRVMRKDVGDRIEIVNGRNQLAICCLTSSSTCTVEKLLEEKPSFPLTLAQAFLRPKNLDLVVEKGTELGVTTFLLFPSDNSEKNSLSSNQTQRLRHLTISALKQCGRLDLPHIEILPPITKWDHFPENSAFGDLDVHTETRPDFQSIFIGPEGGFSKDELKVLREKSTGIRLHKNTLRAETAAICALSIAASGKKRGA